MVANLNSRRKDEILEAKKNERKVEGDSPFAVVGLQEGQVVIPLVSDDLSAGETTNRDDHFVLRVCVGGLFDGCEQGNKKNAKHICHKHKKKWFA